MNIIASNGLIVRVSHDNQLSKFDWMINKLYSVVDRKTFKTQTSVYT